MNHSNRIRAAAAVTGLVAAPAALADSGISSSGWWSMLLIAAIFGVLLVVHKKLT